MSLIDTLLQVTPVDGSPAYNLAGNIDVIVSVLPPGVAIVLSFPPFAIILDAGGVAELIALLTELVAELP
jgi:hypothetical protein